MKPGNDNFSTSSGKTCFVESLTLLSVRTKSINEIFSVENYDQCCFCNRDSTHFSILRVSANALYDCYSGIFVSFIFILNEVGFSCQ